jgi:hypothetical protein
LRCAILGLAKELSTREILDRAAASAFASAHEVSAEQVAIVVVDLNAE